MTKLYVCVGCSVTENTGVGVISSDVVQHKKVTGHKVVRVADAAALPAAQLGGWDNVLQQPIKARIDEDGLGDNP